MDEWFPANMFSVSSVPVPKTTKPVPAVMTKWSVLNKLGFPYIFARMVGPSTHHMAAEGLIYHRETYKLTLIIDIYLHSLRRKLNLGQLRWRLPIHRRVVLREPQLERWVDFVALWEFANGSGNLKSQEILKILWISEIIFLISWSSFNSWIFRLVPRFTTR